MKHLRIIIQYQIGLASMENKKIIKWLIAYVQWGLKNKRINDLVSGNKVLVELEKELRKHELN